MEKAKLFIENFLVYGVGGIISKIIPFVMLPLITRLMPSSVYMGMYDMFHTAVEFGTAIAIMGMYDAMFRMFFEKEEVPFKTTACSTAFFFTLVSAITVSMIMMLVRTGISALLLGSRQYSYLIELAAAATLVGATNGIVSAPTRMQNKRRIFLITNTISPLLSYIVAVPLILKGYYTVALPIGALVSAAMLEITFWCLNHRWFRLRNFDFRLLKAMLYIAVPTMPCFLAYWIFSSCDRVMITNMIGLDAAGIYSVGGKMGQISQLIYVAFAGGWQYFAFSTMKEENQVKSNSKVFEYLGIVSFIAGVFMCTLSYELFKVLFPEEYRGGYLVAPYLFLAPLLQMLEQVAGNQFLVVKKTWPSAFILGIGAVFNVILNFLLIPKIGIEGAAIATLLGYVISNVINIIVLSRMKLFVLSKRFVLSFIITVVYICVWRFFFHDRILAGLICMVLAALCYTYLYRNELVMFLEKIKKVKQ